jgi:hypothetical protein
MGAKGGYQVMRLAPNPHAAADAQRAQYELLDKLPAKPWRRSRPWLAEAAGIRRDRRSI